MRKSKYNVYKLWYQNGSPKICIKLVQNKRDFSRYLKIADVIQKDDPLILVTVGQWFYNAYCQKYQKKNNVWEALRFVNEIDIIFE